MVILSRAHGRTIPCQVGAALPLPSISYGGINGISGTAQLVAGRAWPALLFRRHLITQANIQRSTCPRAVL